MYLQINAIRFRTSHVQNACYVRICKVREVSFALIRLSTKNYATLRYVFVEDDLES